MKRELPASQRAKQLFGWMGLACLLLIIPVKAVRWTNQSFMTSTIVCIAPSILGPAGLLFLILSSSGRLARLTLLQTTLAAAAIALGLEFIQLLPRPGILAKAYYTFDWLDVISSLFSVCAGYLVARLATYRKG